LLTLALVNKSASVVGAQHNNAHLQQARTLAASVTKKWQIFSKYYPATKKTLIA
jgi:hypothetical protein